MNIYYYNNIKYIMLSFFKKKELYDDNITIIEDKLSSYSISSSSTYTSYNSDYNTDINLDKTYKNKLYNIQQDNDDLFKLKNDFYSNYGDFLYKEVCKMYKELYDKKIYEVYDEKIFNECTELLKSRYKKNCIILFYYNKNSKKFNTEVKELYKILYNIKINSIKTKIWLDSVNIIKYNNNMQKYIVVKE